MRLSPEDCCCQEVEEKGDGTPRTVYAQPYECTCTRGLTGEHAFIIPFMDLY